MNLTEPQEIASVANRILSKTEHPAVLWVVYYQVQYSR